MSSISLDDVILWNGENLLVKLQTKHYAILLQFVIASLKYFIYLKAMLKYIVFICQKVYCFLVKHSSALDFNTALNIYFPCMMSTVSSESLQGRQDNSSLGESFIHEMVSGFWLLPIRCQESPNHCSNLHISSSALLQEVLLCGDQIKSQNFVWRSYKVVHPSITSFIYKLAPHSLWDLCAWP